MILFRTKGIAKLAIVCQCVAVTVGFWLWLPLSQQKWPFWDLNVQRYLVYDFVLVTGVAFAYATASNEPWFVQRVFFVCHRQAFRQTAFAAGLLLLLLIGERDQTISRLFLFTFLPILYAILLATQRVIPPVLHRVSFGGIRVQRVLLAGSYRNASKLQGWLRSKEKLGYCISGMLCSDKPPGTLDDLEILGNMEDLERLIVEQDITQVILSEIPQFRGVLTHYTEVCERNGVRLLVVCDFERVLRHPVKMFEDEGIRFIGLRDEPLEDPFARFSKRFLDLLVALPVVLFVLPLTTIFVAYLQWRYSPGPIFFRHLRAGLQNMPFAIYKYRTMHVYNDDPARQATKGDQRIYPGGQWLRKLSMDELPQFLNVLFGDMSVVGPRPHLLQHNEDFAHALSNYPVRASVKPGITGLAQVRGFRGEIRTSEDIVRRVESDIQYLENWSLLMDCWIIIRTAVQVVAPPKTAF